jgi:hypothetical protein
MKKQLKKYKRGGPIKENPKDVYDVTPDIAEGWKQLRDYQGQLTNAFQQRYPKVPVDSILNNLNARQPLFGTRDVPATGDSLINKFGDLSLSQEEINNILGAEQVGIYSKLAQTNRTKGGNDIDQQRFGFRSMIMPQYRTDKVGLYKHLEKEQGGEMEEYGKGGWIQKATASIKRRGTKGKCTPITKSTCTGRAKALAKTFKKMARNRKKGEGGELEQHALGETLGAASSFASALGPATGGVGTIISAGLGLASGVAGLFEQKKQQDLANKQLEEQNAGIRKDYMAGLGSSYNPTGSVMAIGGQFNNMVDAEVEGGEVMKRPSGRLERVRGPKHEQGGVEVNRPEGTIVFSDRLKAPCGKTFAQKASEIMKEMSKYEKLLA